MAESTLELQLELPARAGRRAALEASIRDAIRQGRLQAGSVLPSSRTLAADLGVSRSTVVGVYEQLTAEGFLVSEHGRGTSVAALDVATAPAPDPDLLGPSPRWDFRPGEPDTSAFPRREWLQSLRRVLHEAPTDALSYPDPRGRRELRTTLASHMARTRSVLIDPAGVFVYGGFAAGLGFLAETFRRLGVERVGTERAMLPFHRSILRLAGLEIKTIDVDEQGLVVDDLAAADVGAVVVTPANQYPYAVTMSPERRTQLGAWAEATGAWVVEDDYDGEFRYDRRPIGALQGLAPGRVVYAGTASKTLGAGIRLGWLAVPEGLRTPLLETASIRAGVSTIDQLAFADFIERGHLDRHVRLMRRRYRARRDAIVERLAHAAPWAEVITPAAGLHLVMTLPAPMTEVEVIAAGDAHEVGLFGLQTHHRARSDQQALIVGFSRPAEHEFAAALDHLGDAFSSM